MKLSPARAGTLLAALTTTVVVVLAGCSASSPTAPTPTEAPVLVPLAKADRDTSYRIKPQAAVSNDQWDTVLGKITVQARQGSDTSDNRTPLLSATIRLDNGTITACGMTRPAIWSGTGYDALDLKCEQRLDLATVQAVSVTSKVTT